MRSYDDIIRDHERGVPLSVDDAKALEEFANKAGSFGKSFGESMTTTHDTATDTWNPAVDAFDPVRAGYRTHRHEGDQWSSEISDGEYIRTNADGRHGSPVLEIEFAGNWGSEVFYLPASLPHNTVLAILRANGYEGGDDE